MHVARYALPRGGCWILLSAALFPAVGAEAQMLDPQPLRNTLVSEMGGAEVLWSNPAALGFGDDTALLGLVSFIPEPGETDAGFGQALLGARMGGVGVGVRRERFQPDAGLDPVMGTGLTISVGFGTDRFAAGVSNDQYRRGITSSRWDIGGMWRASNRVWVGAAWRDVASPVVISQDREQSVVGGVTVHSLNERIAISAESTLQGGSLVGYRALLRVHHAAADVRVSAEMDSDGVLRGFGLGFGYRIGANRAFGTLEREREPASASSYMLGAAREL